MSGDTGLEEQPLIFYSSEMTESKRILINKHKVLVKQSLGIYVQERWRTGSPMQG
tara:strand:- start:6831 stop:6995 length:165 start_codon:yes stop_codon:yes gene_type:complete